MAAIIPRLSTAIVRLAIQGDHQKLNDLALKFKLAGITLQNRSGIVSECAHPKMAAKAPPRERERSVIDRLWRGGKRNGKKLRK